MKNLNLTIGEMNIICSDIEKSLAFYRDLLGFDVVREEDGCWHLRCGDSRFLLLPFATPRQERPAYCSEPTFSIDLMVADLDAAKVHLESRGVEILSEPAPNDRRFFIRDPDGLVLEVIGM